MKISLKRTADHTGEEGTVTGRQIKESTGENSIKVILKKLQRVGDGRLPAAGEYFP